MFNLQGSELIIILLLALVVLGPEKLPDAMRKMGQFYAELKKMSSGFQQEFQSVVDEPMREMRDTANLLRDSADFTKLQDGERDEKPKSAEMGAADDAESSEHVPFGDDAESSVEPDGTPARKPFSGDQVSSAAPRPVPGPSPIPTPPPPSSGSLSPSEPLHEADEPPTPPTGEVDTATEAVDAHQVTDRSAGGAAATSAGDRGESDFDRDTHEPDTTATAAPGEARSDPDGDVGAENHDR